LTPPSGKQEETDIALLGGMCLFLSALDYLIPKPLPFMRAGLANLPLLLALDLFSPRSFCLLALIKILGQTFISGTLFSYVFLFSLAGTAVSSAVMYLLRRKLGRWISLAGVGLAGAFTSNAAQLALARLFIFGEGTKYLVPPFLAVGILSGTILGIFAEVFTERSQWAQERRKPSVPLRESGVSQSQPPRKVFFSRTAAFQACGGIMAAVLFLLVSSLVLKGILFAVLWLLTVLVKKKPRMLPMLLFMAGVTACNLFPPYGKVLAALGPFTITLGSLQVGLRKAFTLEGLVLLSKLNVTGNLRFPGRIGRLLGQSLEILEKLKGQKNWLTGKTPVSGLINRLDRLMCNISSDRPL
jgi:heptaprenyl diphosphate synthase